MCPVISSSLQVFGDKKGSFYPQRMDKYDEKKIEKIKRCIHVFLKKFVLYWYFGANSKTLKDQLIIEPLPFEF